MFSLKNVYGKRFSKRGLGFILLCLMAVSLTACAKQNLPAAKNSSEEASKEVSKEADKETDKETEEGTDLVIPVADITEEASFYPVTMDGVEMEIIAVKAEDGSIRTAFNTCQVCYDSGRGYYKQEGSMLVCQNCGNQFPMERVEVEAGGCNPWPIFDGDKTVTEENITISYAFLQESEQIFSNWKQSY
ncbi:MAG: DUF2318 domain-containing protein [Lachnospiraceae bacterium]